MVSKRVAIHTASILKSEIMLISVTT